MGPHTIIHHVVRYNHHPGSPACKQLRRANVHARHVNVDYLDGPRHVNAHRHESGITMTSSATSSGAGAGGGSSTMIMYGATSAQSSSSARASTNAAPGSGGPSAAMFAAIGVVTWVALGMSNAF